MGKAQAVSGVRWSECYPWLQQLEEHGVQPRVVISLIELQKMRVVVTCRKRNDAGVWVEALRLGEVVNTVHLDAAVKAVIRTCATLINELEISASEGTLPPSYVVQLPLPGFPPA